MPEGALKNQLFFFFLSKHSLVVTKPVVSFQSSKKKLVLRVFASLFIALVEGWTFGVAYFAIFADVLLLE